MTAKKASAWQSALAGDGDTALEGRDQLRAEYAELEHRVRFVESAIEEGRLALDAIIGKVSLQICNEVKPDYLKVSFRKLGLPHARCSKQWKSSSGLLIRF